MMSESLSSIITQLNTEEILLTSRRFYHEEIPNPYLFAGLNWTWCRL